MSSFKVITTIETVNSAGAPQNQTWTAAQTSLDDVEWTNIALTASARKFVWNPTVWSDFRPSAFATLAMVADANLYVELTVNVGDADVGYSTFCLVKDTPFVLGADEAFYDYAATTDAAFGGSIDIIDAIRVEASTAAVNLTMIMGV